MFMTSKHLDYHNAAEALLRNMVSCGTGADHFNHFRDHAKELVENERGWRDWKFEEDGGPGFSIGHPIGKIRYIWESVFDNGSGRGALVALRACRDDKLATIWREACRMIFELSGDVKEGAISDGSPEMSMHDAEALGAILMRMTADALRTKI